MKKNNNKNRTCYEDRDDEMEEGNGESCSYSLQHLDYKSFPNTLSNFYC